MSPGVITKQLMTSCIISEMMIYLTSPAYRTDQEFRAYAFSNFPLISFRYTWGVSLPHDSCEWVVWLLPPPTPYCEWAESGAEIPAGIIHTEVVTAAARATPLLGYLSDDDSCPLTCSQWGHTSCLIVVRALVHSTFCSTTRMTLGRLLISKTPQWGNICGRSTHT